MDEMTSQPIPAPRWGQVSLWCANWRAVERMATTRLRPQFVRAERSEILIGWWFVRKATCWRVRYLPRPGRDDQARAHIGQIMRRLAADGAITRWAPTLYEPETRAFGGPAGMDVAHELFHADSYHLLNHLHQHGDRHRSELGVLLACELLCGAGQDHYEQGDIWAQVAAHRPATRPPIATEIDSVHRLLIGRATRSLCDPTWLAAFRDVGAALADLAREGVLTRGLRAVLTHHTLFAWNRAGISARTQALLAQAAASAIFDRELDPPRAVDNQPSPQPTPIRSAAMPTTDTTRDAEQLRAGLVDYIRGRGTFQTKAVERAFATVPRHLFLPEVDLETAYARRVVVTKRAPDGSALSSATHPNMVASMLEQLAVRPGHRVLEIGSATGINAALLAELTGPTGSVVTIEIDQDLADGARAALDAAGYNRVEVVCADGGLGHPQRAPYDRIIVTAGAPDIPSSWWTQLTATGRIVVPLELHDSGLTRSIAFGRDSADRMTSASANVCGFISLRGAYVPAERTVPLGGDITLLLAADQVPSNALSQALTHPAHEEWTGITIDDDDPVEHLDLWLATTSSNFARLSVPTEARRRVDPALRWAGAALHDGTGTLAYLALRPASEHTDELGVIVHGPAATSFAAHTAELLHHWWKQRPTQPIVTAQPIDTPAEQLPTGTHINKTDTTFTINW